MFNFGKRARAENQALNQRIDKLEAMIAALHASPSGTPLESLAVAAVDSVAKNLNAMGGFIGTVGELALSQTAQALGRKGGRKSVKGAARKVNGRFAPRRAAAACRLCHNPAIGNPSVQEIIEHDRHQFGQPPEVLDAYEDEAPPPALEAPAPPAPRAAQPVPDYSSWPHVEMSHEGHNHPPPPQPTAAPVEAGNE